MSEKYRLTVTGFAARQENVSQAGLWAEISKGCKFSTVDQIIDKAKDRKRR